jgi:DNA-binding protein HU-beta
MTKTELIEKVAKAVGGTKADAGRMVNSVFATIQGALKKKEKVTIPGFGSFSVTKRKARKGRNPQTGEEIKIKAKKVAKFIAGKGLRDAVK